MSKLVVLMFYIIIGHVHSSQDIGDGTIVLSYKGERQKIGIVEIYYDGAWSSICADGSFSQAEANVVCRQLQADYGNAKYSNTTRHPEYGTSSIGYEKVSCINPNYQVLLQCSFSMVNVNCVSNSSIIVDCRYQTTWTTHSYEGQVHLADGNYSSEGLVEVKCNDEWGTVCGESFTAYDANTICKQLGYTNAASYNYGTIKRSISIWMNHLSCDKSDVCVTSCASCSSTSITRCSRDVVVKCEYNVNMTATTTTAETCNIPTIHTLSPGAIVAIVIGILVLVAICVTIPVAIICCVCVGAGCCTAYTAIKS